MAITVVRLMDGPLEGIYHELNTGFVRVAGVPAAVLIPHPDHDDETLLYMYRVIIVDRFNAIGRFVREQRDPRA